MVMNPTRIHEDTGSQMWLRPRVAVAQASAPALIQLLAWELLYATGTAIKRQNKKQKNKKQTIKQTKTPPLFSGTNGHLHQAVPNTVESSRFLKPG